MQARPRWLSQAGVREDALYSRPLRAFVLAGGSSLPPTVKVGLGAGPLAPSPVQCAETSSVGMAPAFAGFFGSPKGIAGLEELRISESRADTIRTQERTQAAQDRADGIGVDAATSPQPMRSVPPEPEEDDRYWHLGLPADRDEYTDLPSLAGSRRN
jgi:hypothetical protein